MDIDIDLGQLSEALNYKADLDLGNSSVPHMIETYVNGTSGYIVYSDDGVNGKLCIQWGFTVTGTTGWYGISLLKTYKNALYSCIATQSGATTNVYAVKIGNEEKNTPNTLYVLIASATTGIRWQTMGYIN